MIVRREDYKELLVALLIGTILGGVLGEVFKKYLPVIGQGASIGFKPFTLNLNIFDVTFGFNFKITIAAVIGMLVALVFVMRR